MGIKDKIIIGIKGYISLHWGEIHEYLTSAASLMVNRITNILAFSLVESIAKLI